VSVEASAYEARGASNRKLVAWLTLVGTLAALNYAGRLIATEDMDSNDFVYQWSFAVLGAIQFAIMLGLVLWIAAGGPVRELLALRRPPSWWRSLGLAVGVFVVTLIVAAISEPLLRGGEEQGLTPEGWDSARAAPFVANFIVIAGLAPIVEELTFRGLGYSLLVPRLGRTWTVLAVGLIFGLVHGLIRGLPLLAAFGAGLAWMRARTDSVFPPMATHGLFNAFALIASVAFAGEGGD
jgi:membrane protease YdiL (CAAX protease family)